MVICISNNLYELLNMIGMFLENLSNNDIDHLKKIQFLKQIHSLFDPQFVPHDHNNMEKNLASRSYNFFYFLAFFSLPKAQEYFFTNLLHDDD